MITKEIPREEWITFFDDFNTKHQGWIVTIEEVNAELGDQEETTSLPLVGITADVKGGENQIVMILGGKADADLNRIINQPKHIWFRHSALDQYDAIEVVSQDELKTILQFRFVPVEETGRQLPQPA